jgi:hypothetical protein
LVQVGLDDGRARRSGAFGVLGSWVAQVDFDGARRWSVPPSINSRSYPFSLFLPAGGCCGGGGGSGRGRRRAVALLLLMVAGGAGGGVWCWWRRCWWWVVVVLVVWWWRRRWWPRLRRSGGGGPRRTAGGPASVWVFLLFFKILCRELFLLSVHVCRVGPLGSRHRVLCRPSGGRLCREYSGLCREELALGIAPDSGSDRRRSPSPHLEPSFLKIRRSAAGAWLHCRK